MKSIILNLRSIMIVSLVTTLFSLGAEAGPGRYRFNKENSPGWTLMTPTERTEFQNKMMASKTYDECISIQTEHHALMEARAKEKGTTLNKPRQNVCDRMKDRGILK